MKWFDRFLQDRRFDQARSFIRQGDRVLDIGAYDGVMFRKLDRLISYGIGIEPDLKESVKAPKYQVIPGYFPEACPPNEKFDVITLLAVLEHIPRNAQQKLGNACAEFLKPGGRIVVTVPSPQVDRILELLSALRIIDGMKTEEHYGFVPSDTLQVFSHPSLELMHRSTFQFGLNNLFVFRKKGEK